MLPRLARHALSLVLLLLSAVAAADSTVLRTFTFPEVGKLQMRAPEGWPVEMRASSRSELPTVAFGPRDEVTFQVLITPLSSSGRAKALMAADMRRMVEMSAQEAQAQSVEKTLALQELDAGTHRGYYFSATDRAPGPDEYKYMTQGVLALEDVLLTFTILHNDGHESVVAAALSMLKTAAQLRDL
jgi:hypothetical protein